MKKLIGKVSVGIIFLMFGFVIITQLKNIDAQNQASQEQVSNPEILVENEQLKKGKEELTQKVSELTSKVEEYEKEAAGTTEASKTLLDELQKTRVRAGLTDVEGQGIIIYVNPKTVTDSTGILGSQGPVNSVVDTNLVTLINELYAAGAETISINDIRLTGNTGIRSINNNTSIYVNDERISAQSQIVIKAIGDKTALDSTMKFAGVIPQEMKNTCDVTWDSKDSITILKSNSTVKYKFIQEVK